MLSNNTFLETRIQRLLDGLFFIEKGLSLHVHRMLKMSRFYKLAEILSKIFVIKTKENWPPYLRSWFDKLTIWCQLNFYQNILCNHCLHDLHLYIWKMLTNREMVNLRKMGTICDFSLYFTINCVTTGA